MPPDMTQHTLPWVLRGDGKRNLSESTFYSLTFWCLAYVPHSSDWDVIYCVGVILVIVNIHFILLLFPFYMSLLPLFSLFIFFYIFSFRFLYFLYIFSSFFPWDWQSHSYVILPPLGTLIGFWPLPLHKVVPSHPQAWKNLILPPFTYTFLQGIINASWPGEEFANVHSLFVIGVLKKTFHVTLSTD